MYTRHELWRPGSICNLLWPLTLRPVHQDQTIRLPARRHLLAGPGPGASWQLGNRDPRCHLLKGMPHDEQIVWQTTLPVFAKSVFAKHKESFCKGRICPAKRINFFLRKYFLCSIVVSLHITEWCPHFNSLAIPCFGGHFVDSKPYSWKQNFLRRETVCQGPMGVWQTARWENNRNCSKKVASCGSPFISEGLCFVRLGAVWLPEAEATYCASPTCRTCRTWGGSNKRQLTPMGSNVTDPRMAGMSNSPGASSTFFCIFLLFTARWLPLEVASAARQSQCLE